MHVEYLPSSHEITPHMLSYHPTTLYTLKSKQNLMGDGSEMILEGFRQSLIVHRRNDIGYGLQCAYLNGHFHIHCHMLET